MELSNFGAVLTFAAEMEAADAQFYCGLMENPALEEFRSAFETIVAALKKNEKELLLARSENVTEMILELIRHFDSRAFLSDRKEVPADAAWRQP